MLFSRIKLLKSTYFSDDFLCFLYGIFLSLLELKKQIISVMDNQIIIYQTEDGLTRINVKVEDETVWLSQQQMAELFQCSRTNVVEHIKNIYEEGELVEEATCWKFRQVRLEVKTQARV